MSVQSIDVIREVFRIWNQPAQSRLDSQAVVDALNRIWNQRKLDFGLSGGSFLAQVSEPFAIDTDSRISTLLDANVPEHFLQARLEVRGADTGHDTDWTEVRIGNYADWETYRGQSARFAAFFGSADTPSIIVNHSPQNLMYRLIYEPDSANAGEEDDGLAMPRLFQPLLVYDLAIEAGMLIDDDSPEFARRLQNRTPQLIARQQDALQRFKKWLASRNSQSVETRQGFNERDSSSSLRAVLGGVPTNVYIGGDYNWND